MLKGQVEQRDKATLLPVRNVSDDDQKIARGVMSGEGLLILLLVGVIAGWLAGHLVQGTGLGLVGDMVVGVAGSLIGGLLLPKLGVHLGSGTLAAIVNATIGAVVLLFIIRLVQGGGGFGARFRGFGRRW
jgi:uncharacterized membrane protein YeaQ/YmgE (transglycosylase-associated protein family)